MLSLSDALSSDLLVRLSTKYSEDLFGYFACKDELIVRVLLGHTLRYQTVSYFFCK